MPLTHTRQFRVRYYECDAYGHVNNANYFRYMTETAFDASSAAGYDLSAYEDLGHIWLPRTKTVEYLKPLRYGDTVEVKTWVEDYRRVRSRRAYEFRLLGENQLAAHGHTDWIYLNTETQRPAKIPEEMMRKFFPEGLPEEAPRRQAFPSAPPAPDGAVTLYKDIAWSQIDPAQHVNNAEYLRMIEDAGVAATAQLGWPMARITEEGFAVVARKIEIEYRLQAKMGEQVEITTFVSDMKPASCIRHCLIQYPNGGGLIAQARTLFAFVGLENGRPARIPAHLVQDFAPHTAGEPVR